MKKYLFFLMIALMAAADVFAAAEKTSAVGCDSIRGEEIVASAKQYLGIPYRRGRMNPKSGFDCSGFTSYVFKKQNIELPRVSRMQYSPEASIDDKRELQAGDLVFFSGSRVSKRIGHVGIVTSVDSDGNFSFIHASCSQGVVVSSSQEAYYSKRYIGACRVLN